MPNLINHQMMINSSSSCSSVMSPKKYDVFLSFRGEDTRGNITSHLHAALMQKRVETYIDYRLEKGDEISGALITAIEESHVSVVIFSENYASSKWCLDEVAKIVECKKERGQVVVPVFYKVDPSHVRKQRGRYEVEFARHEQDLNTDLHRVHKWRRALTEAANLAGWDSQTYTYRTESEFIKDIVKDILQKLDLIYPVELKGLVGIEENYVGVESLLEIGSREVRMIGIWGMGGIGKTTLAIALHAKLSSQFEGHCFLASVREQSEKCGLNVLRNKLFSALLEEENLHVDIPKVESHFVTRRLRRKKVFIVLDDVATSEQLEGLISDSDCLGPGSRVVVTTRDRHIFSHVDGIYEVKELNKHDSLQLFCLNSFRKMHPENGYEELSESAIGHCKGNPLALKVLGARLRRRSKEAWKSVLKKLQKHISDVKIHGVLRLSYDDLDPTEKDIFLDIACFFKGESRDHVASVLEACDFFAAFGIEVLLDKSLITISNKDTIEMHDLIQEMGWSIVHQESIKDPGRRSRLWDPEEVYDVLKYNRGTEAIEGIILDMSRIEDLHLSSNSFEKMFNIRFLKFHYGKWSGTCNVNLPNGLQSLSDKLRYLEWHRYCLESLPSTFSANLLVELSMPYSNLEKLWDGVQSVVNLKEIDLRSCERLVEVPDLCMATSLEELTLAQCKSLRRVHPSILSLHELKNLDLEGCTELGSLQTGNHLRSLINLRLSNCSSLSEFSVSSEQLERVWLDGTIIQELPQSIWRCKKLKLIDLQGCDNLHGFGGIGIGSGSGSGSSSSSLNSLVLSGCKQLNAPNLCFSLDALRSLTSLDLRNCCNLQTLPDSIALLSSLQRLSLSGSNVVSLSSPNILNMLLQLKELLLDDCRELVSLPHELPPSLRVLSAVNCTSLETTHLAPLPFDHRPVPQPRPQSVFFPGTRVPESFSFRAQGGANMVTIPHLPTPGLYGFVFCLILSRSPPKYGYVGFSVYQCSRRIGGKSTFLGNLHLDSDHVFLWYLDLKTGTGDISLYGQLQESGAWDRPYDISFEFLLEDGDDRELWSAKGITGCGVCPLYAHSQVLQPQHNGLGSSKVDNIVQLESNVSTSKEIIGSNLRNEDDQTKKLQLQHQTITTGALQDDKVDTNEHNSCHSVTASGRKRKPQSFKEEDCYTNSIPKDQIILYDTPRASNMDSNQTIEMMVSEEKELTNNKIDKCSEPVLVEIENPQIEPDHWDPIAELESLLCDSYKLSPISTTVSSVQQGPNVAAILENLETLLETPLETMSSDDGVKQQLHHVLEQLGQFEDQIPVRLHPVICKLKTFMEGTVEVRFVTAQKTIQDYDQLLQSRSLLSTQLESAKARKDRIDSKVSQGKTRLENINSEIVELEQRLSGLVESRDKLKRELGYCDVEDSKLKSEVEQWVRECKYVVMGLKKSGSSYKEALTNKKTAENEWADLKKNFVANKI